MMGSTGLTPVVGGRNTSPVPTEISRNDTSAALMPATTARSAGVAVPVTSDFTVMNRRRALRPLSRDRRARLRARGSGARLSRLPEMNAERSAPAPHRSAFRAGREGPLPAVEPRDRGEGRSKARARARVV